MRKALGLLLILLSTTAVAQKHGNIWYFGNRCGLDFSGNSPAVLYNGQSGTDTAWYGVQEGCASICDSAGRLLFYTGGHTIWQANHTRMPNGSGLMGDQSSTQSSIIVPKPGSNSIFYVFTSDGFQKYGPGAPYGPPLGYRYNIVDMCLNGGAGDVIPGKKNLLLADSSTEKLCACKEPNGNGYWIMGHKMFSNEFHAWHLTAGGITDSVVTKIGYVHGPTYNLRGSAQGQMKFSPDCSKLAIVMGNIDPCILEVFDFNPATGVVSNLCHMAPDSSSTTSVGKRGYGIEFSPDGSKLYCGTSGGVGGGRIHQYSLTSGNCGAIRSSDFLLYDNNPPTNTLLFGMQAAPDGKIYVVSKTWSTLGRINNPNATGAAAGFDTVAIQLDTASLPNPNGPTHRVYTTPSFVAGFKYHHAVPCATVPPTSLDAILARSEIMLYPNPSEGVTVLSIDHRLKIADMQLLIRDAFGRVVKRIAVVSSKQSLDLSNLVPAFYSYQLYQQGELVKAGKLLIE